MAMTNLDPTTTYTLTSTVQRNFVDLPPQLILGACRPALAHQALLADPSIAALLPCNVVVRAIDAETTLVEAFDPAFMAGMAGSEAVRRVATDARERLTNMLDTVSKEA